jgi:hypothetical protein
MKHGGYLRLSADALRHTSHLGHRDKFLLRTDLPPALGQRRASFLRGLESRPPQMLVVTPRPFLSGLLVYEKLTYWPEFTTRAGITTS